MIVLFRDSSINYWLDNSVVDCGNVDTPNTNLEIVFPPDYDYEMIAKQIKENEIKENNSIKYAIHELDACLKYNPNKGYKKYNKTINNNVSFNKTKNNNVSFNKTINNNVSFNKTKNNKNNNKKSEVVYTTTNLFF